jgi:hypothetical protein
MQTNLLHKENAKVTKVLNFEERALGERARDHGSLERGNADGSLAQKAAKVTKVLNFEERALGERARDHGSLERGNADGSCTEGREGHEGTKL